MIVFEYESAGMYICMADISAADPDRTDGFSEGRIKKLSRLKNEKERKRSACAELTLIHAVKKLFPGCALPVAYAYDTNGKPYFTELKDVWFSLSHSGGYAACAVCASPVGLDIQTERKRSEGIMRRCFTEKERELASDDGSFTAVWARKEAVSKAVGLGLQIGFSDIDVTGDTVIYNGSRYSVEDIDCRADGCRMAAARLI